MTRIYSIASIVDRNIPKNASTHYSYDIYPSKTATPKTRAGVVRKPAFQRKTVKDARPLPQKETIILGPIVEAPKPRNTFRKDINKEALAEYFDNDVLPTREEIAQDKLDTWLTQTAIELENADIAKAEAKTTDEEIRAFVEPIRTVANKIIREIPAKPETHFYDETRMAENAFIADRFIQKYSGADTAAAMRALHKLSQPRNKRLERMLFRSFQKTK